MIIQIQFARRYRLHNKFYHTHTINANREQMKTQATEMPTEMITDNLNEIKFILVRSKHPMKTSHWLLRKFKEMLVENRLNREDIANSARCTRAAQLYGDLEQA